MNTASFRRLSGTLLLLVPIALSQCKKSGGTASGSNSSGNGSTYYMRFKLNGNSVEYDSEPSATLTHSSSDGLYSAVLFAYKDVNAGSKNAATIIVYSASAIAANVGYNDPQKAQETDGSLVPQSTVFWYDSTGTGYLTAGEFSDANGNIPVAGIVADARLTITELTTTDVKGTFSGTVYRPDLAVSDVITDGEFYLKRQ